MTGRFAPTPSGRMHIGNITAMLAAWLDSRACGQRMLLRIEDIDTPRVLPDADRWIMDDLDWLGLDWDGEPVYQSQRLDLYEQTFQALADQTIAINDGPQPVSSTYADSPTYDSPTYVVPAVSRETNEPDSLPPHSRKTGIGWADPQGITQGVTQGFTQSGTRDNVPDATQAASSMPLIYPCFCSRADIRAASAPQEGDGFQIYPGTCRRLMHDHPDEVRARLARGERHSWRIAMPDAAVTFDDAVFGPQSFDLARDIGDSVIRRSDGLFGYQFVVTVDDLMMGVDSIVRGRDLLRSTALQATIRERLLATTLRAPSDEGAVGRRPTGGETTPAYETTPAHPAYTHIPLIDNAAGRRLAKRERSLDMGALRARGVTAEQVTGVCAWLLHLLDTPEPCAPTDLLEGFRDHGWGHLRADHADRRLDPTDPALPRWLAAALH